MDNASKPVCKYGSKCYRRNRQHLEEYRHPAPEEQTKPAPLKRPASPDEQETCKSPKNVGNASKKRFVTISDFFCSPSGSKVDEENTKSKVTTTERSPSPSTASSSAPASTLSASDGQRAIKETFLVQMPSDFFAFWDLCITLNPESPNDALRAIGLRLVGPFDVMSGRLSVSRVCGNDDRLRYYRYYFDPPEFLTVIRGDEKTQYHMGYFRDDPSEMPCFVAGNAAAKDGTFKRLGENLFAAVNSHISDLLRAAPRTGMEGIKSLQEKITRFAKSKAYSLDTNVKCTRDRHLIARPFHGLGLVVRVVNDVGYRPLPENSAGLRRIFRKIASADTDAARDKAFDDLQEIITLVQFANDEGDYGEGLELGLNLLTFGGDVFNGSILSLLSTAYELLNRQPFARIIAAHLQHRHNSIDKISAL